MFRKMYYEDEDLTAAQAKIVRKVGLHKMRRDKKVNVVGLGTNAEEFRKNREVSFKRSSSESIEDLKPNKSRSKGVRKTKVIGSRTLVDTESGEYIIADVLVSHNSEYNFEKIFLRNFLGMLELFGEKKIKIICWLLKHRSKANNLVSATYKQISEELCVSEKIVNTTMKKLLDTGAISSTHKGSYTVNPNIIYKGGRSKRMAILNIFDKGKHKQLSLFNTNH